MLMVFVVPFNINIMWCTNVNCLSAMWCLDVTKGAFTTCGVEMSPSPHKNCQGSGWFQKVYKGTWNF